MTSKTPASRTPGWFVRRFGKSEPDAAFKSLLDEAENEASSKGEGPPREDMHWDELAIWLDGYARSGMASDEIVRKFRSECGGVADWTIWFTSPGEPEHEEFILSCWDRDDAARWSAKKMEELDCAEAYGWYEEPESSKGSSWSIRREGGEIPGTLKTAEGNIVAF